MANASGTPWSGNPYAPQIDYELYFAEKANFAGFLIGAILYGIVIVLFFECMNALLHPINRATEGIRWGLVAHTAAMFSFVTIYTALNLQIQSISYIDNRNFPGTDGTPWPGPIGYEFFIYYKAISIVPSVAFQMNTWLADGILLYRCYLTWARNYWVVVLPFLMYLASLATGIGFIYEMTRMVSYGSDDGSTINFGVPYYTISLSLNVLLTLLIVTRLALHHRAVNKALGTSAPSGGLYKALVTMLVESCALYAVSYLLFIGPWASGSAVSNIFFPILAETQVISPFLIILRVAKKRTWAGDTIIPGNAGPLRASGQGEPRAGNGTSVEGYSIHSMDSNRKTPGELEIGVC